MLKSPFRADWPTLHFVVTGIVLEEYELYLIVHLYGDREDQKKWHRSFRGSLLELLDNEKIERFVMTYHYDGKESDNLYLCIDVPELSECTMDALLEVQSLQPLTDYLTLEIQATQIRIGNYEEEVRNGL